MNLCLIVWTLDVSNCEGWCYGCFMYLSINWKNVNLNVVVAYMGYIFVLVVVVSGFYS